MFSYLPVKVAGTRGSNSMSLLEVYKI